MAPGLDEVVKALDAAMNWSSSADVRREATAYLEQVKAVDPRTAVQLGIALAGSDKASYIRLFGVQLLQIAVLGKWALFSAEEQQQLSALSFDLLLASAGMEVDRSFRSKAAALLADIVRQGGPKLWEDLLPALVKLSSSGPAHAEAAALVLQFLPEDITVHNEDLDGDKRRQWLVTLTATLPQVLPFVCSLLESNFTAALGAVQRGDVASGRSHAAAVSAALSAACAYAEWAPVAALGGAKLVDACGYLLSASEFRLAACDFLKILAARRRQQEDQQAFDAAMASLFTFSIGAARATLQTLSNATAASANPEEPEYDPEEAELAQNLCEVFAALTPTNLHRLAVKDDNIMPQLLEVLMQFFNSSIFSLHAQSLPLWTVLLRESAIASGAPVGYQGIRPAKAERDQNKSSWCLVPPNHCVALLEIVVKHLQRQGQGQGPPGEDDLLGSSTASDYSQYRSKLLELIRLAAAQQPYAAACKSSAMLEAATALVGRQPQPDQTVIAAVEAAQVFLECTLSGIPDPVMAAAAAFSTNTSALPDDLSLVLEGVVKQLLELQWNNANGALVELHAHLLDNLGPYCRHNPNAAGQTVAKLFGLLRQQTPIAMGAEPLGRPEKAEERLPRLQACTSVLRICRSAAPALTQHLKTMVDTVNQVAEDARVRRGKNLVVTGETILLGEALISVAAAAGPQEESMVLEWLLAPIRQRWTDPEWQKLFLKDAADFSRLLTHATDSSEAENFWFLYHSVMLFERCMRRTAMPVHSVNAALQRPPVPGMGPPGSAATGASPAPHPAGVHLSWILPPLLQVLRWLHALWQPEVRACLPQLVSEAMDVGNYEQSVMLGLATPSQAAQSSGPVTEERVGMITRRNWLKGLRDNGYGFIGMAAVNAKEILFSLSDSIAQQLLLACTEELGPMELRHLKSLLKQIVSGICRSCPRERWHTWLGPIIPPVLQHCASRLKQGWGAKLQALGTPAVGNAAVREEMYQDKMLRDLSREYCLLLMSLPRLPPLAPTASTPVSQQSPSDGQGPAQGAPQATPPVVLETPGRPDSLFWFLLELQPEPMMVVLAGGVEAMSWPDTEAANKAICFCSGVTALPEFHITPASPQTSQAAGAASALDPAGKQQLSAYLREAVGRSMFSGCMTALTLESNATAQAEILSLMRDIYFKLVFGGLSATPKEALLSLPGMSSTSIDNLEATLKRSGSPKEQSKALRALLVSIGGDHLKALAVQRSTTTITNVSGFVKKLNHDAQVATQSAPEGAATRSSTGLAAIATGTKE